MTLGEQLENYRLERGFSKSEMSQKLGMTRQHYYNLLKGNYTPNREHRERLCIVLDLNNIQLTKLIKGE